MSHSYVSRLARKVVGIATSTALAVSGVLVLSVATSIPSATPASAAGLGGPVQLDGMDPVCHSTGESTGQYIAAVLKSLHDQATIGTTDGSIAILGTAVSNACGASFDASNASNAVATQYLNDFPAGSKPSWTLHSDAAAINSFFAALTAGTATPKVIWIPDDWGRSSDAETALSDNAEAIANFVNAGGGLFSNNGSYGWLATLLPNAQFVSGGCNGGPALSTDGQNAFPTLTNQMVEACWHGSFWGSYPGLVSLVEWPYDALMTGASPTPMAPVAIGGANVTMPSSFTLVTDPPQAIPSDTVEVIASAIGLDGTIYSGVDVTFSITSGPHAGWTATATTGSDGKARATLTYASDGTDVINASATVNGSAKTQTYNLDWAPAFTPTRYVDAILGTMTAGTAYSNGVAADGRPAPTYAITSGALPAGLTLNTETGAITGTPTTAGAFTFEVTATNPAGSAAKTFSGSVGAPVASSPSWTDDTLATPSNGVAYSDGIAASGYPTPTYAVTAGSLPDGLTLDTATGSITGTPTGSGSYSFTITATNSGGSVTRSFSGTVKRAPYWTDSDLPAFTMNVAVSDGLSAGGSPAPSYSITAGALPAGLTLNPTTGAITGTPSAVESYSFTITASNTEGSEDLVFSGAVTDPTPTWSDSTLGAFYLNVPFANGVQAASGQGVTYSITAGTLPDGLTLDPATGEISGTPTTVGAYSFEVTATAQGTNPPLAVSLTFSGSVEDSTPVWSDPTLDDIKAGVPYSDGLVAASPADVTYSITAGALPAGLTLDPATGAITGTVTTPVAYYFEITATSPGGSVTLVFSGTVVQNPPSFSDSALGDGVQAAPYSDQIAASSFDTVTYTITAGALPAGLTLNSATGEISGTPTTPGSYTFTITASSSGGDSTITRTIVIASLAFEPVKDIENAGSEEGSLDFSTAPTGSSISVSAPKATDNNVAGTASVSGNKVIYTPNQGFSGLAKVKVTIVINGYAEEREYTFTVNPAPVTAGTYSTAPLKKDSAWMNSPRAVGGTVINWDASPNAIGYEVWQVDSSAVSSAAVRAMAGKLVCATTSETSCSLRTIAGPATKFQVIAHGRDNLRSAVTEVKHKRSSMKRGSKALYAQFASGSYTLSSLAKSELRALARQVRTAGYTDVLLTGNTDDRGSLWYNRWLGQKRADAVQSYLQGLLPSVEIRTVSKWNTEPLSKKKTEAARTLNRRVDVYLS